MSKAKGIGVVGLLFHPAPIFFVVLQPRTPQNDTMGISVLAFPISIETIPAKAGIQRLLPVFASEGEAISVFQP